MCLLITLIAAVVATIIWYFRIGKGTYYLEALCCMYWGASVMWFVDAVVEYVELGADFFNQSVDALINDSLLGLSVVVLALVVWLVILLIKDPRGAFITFLKKNK